MGRFVFRLPDGWPADERMASTLHIVGLEGVPSPCRVSKPDNQWVLTRHRDESGHINLCCPVEGFGEIVLATGTLPERDEPPFSLVLELARGTANRLRNQISIWHEGGLKIPHDVTVRTNQAVELLACSIFENDNQASDRFAIQSLSEAMHAIFLLCRAFADEVVPMRKSQFNCPMFWLAITHSPHQNGMDRELVDLADIQQIAGPNDRQWDADLPTILGPLIDVAPGGLPDVYLEADSFDLRRSLILRDIRERFTGLHPSIKMIHAVSGLNGIGHRSLSYPQQLQLTIDVLQLIEDSSLGLPVMVSFDAPWAERLAWSVGGIPPSQIADSLLRRGVRLPMLGLDINLDYWPGGSLLRDPLQWIDLIDIWSQLGLPLVICLRAPNLVDQSSAKSVRGSMTDRQLANYLEIVIPMILARPLVQGIIWRQANDLDDPRFPGAGLKTADQKSKPLLHLLRQLKQKYW